jgi:hypothetical protein
LAYTHDPGKNSQFELFKEDDFKFTFQYLYSEMANADVGKKKALKMLLNCLIFYYNAWHGVSPNYGGFKFVK